MERTVHDIVSCLHLFLGNHLDLREVRPEIILNRKFRNRKAQRSEWRLIKKTNVRLEITLSKMSYSKVDLKKWTPLHPRDLHTKYSKLETNSETLNVLLPCASPVTCL